MSCRKTAKAGKAYVRAQRPGQTLILGHQNLYFVLEKWNQKCALLRQSVSVSSLHLLHFSLLSLELTSMQKEPAQREQMCLCPPPGSNVPALWGHPLDKQNKEKQQNPPCIFTQFEFQHLTIYLCIYSYSSLNIHTEGQYWSESWWYGKANATGQ